MKYEKAMTEVVRFEQYYDFMTGSLIGNHCSDYSFGNYHCGDYYKGISCSSFTNTKTGYHCGTYNGHAPGGCTGFTPANAGWTCYVF